MDTPAGWYPDPLGRFDHRYWDGTAWTEHVSRDGRQEIDPVDGASGATSAASSGTAPGGATATDPTPDSAPTDVSWTAPGTGAPAAPTHGGGGAPPPPGPSWPGTGSGLPPSHPGLGSGPTKTNVLAVLSLVAALVWVFGVGSLAAIVLGILGRKRIRESGGREGGGGFAVAGIVLGTLGLLATIAFFAAVAFFINEAGIEVDADGNVTFDESGLFSDSDLARWEALYSTAEAQEEYWYDKGTYTADVGELETYGLDLSGGPEVVVPIADDETFCLELTDEAGVWHLREDFYEVEEGPCPLR